MSERKVLNKYYPPDFDPTKLPKLKQQRNRQFVIRIMAPFSMRCKTCGEYIYKGRKFNSRMETVENETYLGLRIYRFYIRCTKCISEITFKTDPEHTDYVMEHGATRNFEAYRRLEERIEKEKKDREEEEANNPMKALENRTKDSKREMESIEKLEELKDLNQRIASIDPEKLIQEHLKESQRILQLQEEEDEKLVKQMFSGNSGIGYVKRLIDNSDSDGSDDEKRSKNLKRSYNIPEAPSRKDNTFESYLPGPSKKVPRKIELKNSTEPEVLRNVSVKEKCSGQNESRNMNKKDDSNTNKTETNKNLETNIDKLQALPTYKINLKKSNNLSSQSIKKTSLNIMGNYDSDSDEISD